MNVNHLDEESAYDRYNEALDEAYEPVSIGEGVFYASDILSKCDPIAYRVGFADWVDSMSDEFTVEGYTS